MGFAQIPLTCSGTSMKSVRVAEVSDCTQNNTAETLFSLVAQDKGSNGAVATATLQASSLGRRARAA
jgi:hypothetical protein